jgi:hypothetical protein
MPCICLVAMELVHGLDPNPARFAEIDHAHLDLPAPPVLGM